MSDLDRVCVAVGIRLRCDVPNCIRPANKFEDGVKMCEEHRKSYLNEARVC